MRETGSTNINNKINISNDGIWSYKLKTEQLIYSNINKVFNFYSTPKNLNLITPPFLNFKILGNEYQDTTEGKIFIYKLKLHNLPVFWKSKIEQWSPPFKFVDKQLFGPYLKWHHHHIFEDLGKETKVIDIVYYTVPFGSALHKLFVKKDLINIFNYRKESLNNIFNKRGEK